jgi:hypothetical protein
MANWCVIGEKTAGGCVSESVRTARPSRASLGGQCGSFNEELVVAVHHNAVVDGEEAMHICGGQRGS